MSYAALKALIDSDAGNAAKTDAQVLAWLNETVSVIGPISTKRMWGWAVTEDLGRVLAEKRDNIALSNTERGLARGMLAIMDGAQDFDVGDPSAQSFLASAVSLAVITQAQRDSLEALATTTPTRLANAGLPAQAEIDVNRARAL